MGKTADLTAVQRTIIDTLHQEGKTQKEISQRASCSQSAVSKHIHKKSVGRGKCGRKRCTTKRDDRSLNSIVKKSRFQNLGELQRQWTEAGVQVSKATVHRRVREMGYNSRIPMVKPLLNSRQRKKRLTWAMEKKHWTVAEWSKVLFSDESKFCMSFGSQGARVWRKAGEEQNPSCLKSTVSDGLGSHVSCWCWSTVFQVQSKCSCVPRDFRALHASVCWKAPWRWWFHFPAWSGTCPQCQNHQ